MASAGWIPALNMSYSLSFNSFKGMNLSMTFGENSHSSMYGATLCRCFQAAVQSVIPDFPDFVCS